VYQGRRAPAMNLPGLRQLQLHQDAAHVLFGRSLGYLQAAAELGQTVIHRDIWRGGPPLTASANDAEGQPGGTAAPHQPGDLMPVEVVSVDLGQRRRDAQAPQLGSTPVVDQRLVMLNGLVAGGGHGRFHRSPRNRGGMAQGQARGADIIPAVARVDGRAPLAGQCLEHRQSDAARRRDGQVHVLQRPFQRELRREVATGDLVQTDNWSLTSPIG
jgi:hypothetical protein